MVKVWCVGWLLARPGRGRCVQEEDVEDVAGCSWAQPRPAEAAQRLALRHSGAGRGYGEVGGHGYKQINNSTGSRVGQF